MTLLAVAVYFPCGTCEPFLIGRTRPAGKHASRKVPARDTIRRPMHSRNTSHTHPCEAGPTTVLTYTIGEHHALASCAWT